VFVPVQLDARTEEGNTIIRRQELKENNAWKTVHRIDLDITIDKKALKYLKKDLNKLKVPVNIDYLAENLKEYFANDVKEIIGSKLVKIYDPVNDYNQGDVVTRRFDKLRMSKKKEVEFNDYAVGIVYDKIYQENENYDLICVRWKDPSVMKQEEFYRSINAVRYYPVNIGRKPGKVKYLGEEGRLEEKEKVEEELNAALTRFLRERLLDVIFDDEDLVNWGNLWYLIDLLEEVEYEKINRISKMLDSSRLPIATEKFIRDIFKVRTENPKFLHYRFSVNYTMDTYFKEKFICMSHFSGGKWDLRSKYPPDFGLKPIRITIPKFKKEEKKPNVLLEYDDLDENIKAILEPRETEKGNGEDDVWKVVLTYNELICGAIETTDAPAGFFPDDIEVVFYDTANNSKYFVENHFGSKFISNLNKYFDSGNAVPGGILYIKKTDIPATFEIFRTETQEGKTYNRLKYNVQSDEVTIKDETVEYTGEVDEFTFIDPLCISELESSRKKYHRFKNSFDVLIEIFRKFTGPIHFLKLVSLVNVIQKLPLEAVASALSAYKCFYHIEKNGEPGYFWLNTDLAGSAKLRKEISSRIREILSEDLLPKIEKVIYFKPKTYLYQMPEKVWNVAQQYEYLPLPLNFGNQEMHLSDNVVLMVNDVVQAAVRVNNVKEAIPPYIASELPKKEYIALIGCEVLGAGPCDAVEFPFPPDPGVLVEIDKNVFEQILEHYNQAEGTTTGKEETKEKKK
jgi:hypothetical protein